MTKETRTPTIESDLLSPAMQQRLRQRIARHDGAIAPVSVEIQAELAQLDASPAAHAETERRSYQARRALLVAQQEYLARLAQAAAVEAPPQRRRFWAQLRGGRPTPVRE